MAALMVSLQNDLTITTLAVGGVLTHSNVERASIFSSDRDIAFANGYASGGYAMNEIGDYFGLHH